MTIRIEEGTKHGYSTDRPVAVVTHGFVQDDYIKLLPDMVKKVNVETVLKTMINEHGFEFVESVLSRLNPKPVSKAAQAGDIEPTCIVMVGSNVIAKNDEAGCMTRAKSFAESTSKDAVIRVMREIHRITITTRTERNVQEMVL